MSYYAFEFEGVPKHGHTLFLLVISLYWRRDGVTRVEVTAEVFVVGSVDTKPVRAIRNGQLFILRDGKTYTVQGQEVR